MSRWPSRTVEERFMEKVNKTDGCWEWTAHLYRGYGRFTISNTRSSQKAHRVAYELFVGPLDSDVVLHHTCENTRCVNPAHLEPMAQEVHALIGDAPPASNARKTHCPKGHEYTEENTVYHGPKGAPATWRSCRICRHAHNVARAAAAKRARHAARATA